MTQMDPRHFAFIEGNAAEITRDLPSSRNLSRITNTRRDLIALAQMRHAVSLAAKLRTVEGVLRDSATKSAAYMEDPEGTRSDLATINESLREHLLNARALESTLRSLSRLTQQLENQQDLTEAINAAQQLLSALGKADDDITSLIDIHDSSY